VQTVPAQQASLDALYTLSLMTIPDGWAKTRGIAVGEAAAAAMIAARTGDGRFGTYRFPVGTGRGEWRPVLPAFVNDPNAWLKDVKPFLVESASQFGSRGPRPLKSPLYAREFNEVKELGRATSTLRTADQTHAARYWAENPPNTWGRVARTLSAQEGLSLVENARLFAMLYMTAADALITIWADKARFLFWRPITAIEEADTDGNPLTEKGSRMAAADRQPALHGAPVGPRRPEQLLRGDAPGRLRHGRGRLDGHQQRRADAQLRPPLKSDRRGGRGAHLVRDPLPLRR
jgi:hypothetical protein